MKKTYSPEYLAEHRALMDQVLEEGGKRIRRSVDRLIAMGIVDKDGNRLKKDVYKRQALLHAFQNEVDAVLPGPFHAAQGGADIILLAHLRLRPFDRGVVAGSPRQPSTHA